jgi:hypothetical protein
MTRINAKQGLNWDYTTTLTKRIIEMDSLVGLFAVLDNLQKT